MYTYSLTKRSFKGLLLNFKKAGLCRPPRLVPPGMLPTGSPRFRDLPVPPDFEIYQRFPYIVLLSKYFKYLSKVLSKAIFKK